VLEEKKLLPRGFWTGAGPYNDIVLSSRVRFARNIRSVPFPNRFDESEAQIVKALGEKFIRDSLFQQSVLMDLSGMDKHRKRLLRERNIITMEMELAENSAVIINEKDDFSIMLNEEDHIRIQVIRPGLQIREAYEMADRIDDELNRFVPYAHSPEYGYLTACPSNLGTGMKVSVLLHLPVLTMKKNLSLLTGQLQNPGVVIAGTAGEGIRTYGAIYQLSNRVSLGISEVDIIEIMDGVISRIIDLEDSARDEYVSQSRLELEDRIWRSFGILQYSKRISYAEAIEHLSNVRLGIILAIVKNVDIVQINSLMVTIQWAHLQEMFKRTFNSTLESDEARSNYLRMNFSAMECGNV
jgi:protein arginine kinase